MFGERVELHTVPAERVTKTSNGRCDAPGGTELFLVLRVYI